MGKGLHSMDAPAGTFIQFACAANQTANDGLPTERNGLFTKHLLNHMENSNEDIVQIFQDVAADVYEESKHQQSPISMNGIRRRGRIYLKDVSNTKQSNKH